MVGDSRIPILCVDDETRVLDALDRLLRDRYHVHVATSGAAALAMLRENPEVAVILSDMRMPQMDGAEFLRQARELNPRAIRVLLTGHADSAAAVRAINDGQVFRFVSKPCKATQLAGVLDDCVRQYDLTMAERSLMQRTIVGCMKAIVDVMAFANPAAMGRAVRLKRRVSAVAAELDNENHWEVEAAALFSGMGSLCLPEDLQQKLASAVPLSPGERAAVRDGLNLANTLLEHVPRMHAVARLLHLAADFDVSPAADQVERTQAELLRLAMDLDRLEMHGAAPSEAIARAASRERYTTHLLDAAARSVKKSEQALERILLPVHSLRPGMILAEDIHTGEGVLLIPRGYEITHALLEKISNFTRQPAQKKFNVLVPHAGSMARKVAAHGD